MSLSTEGVAQLLLGEVPKLFEDLDQGLLLAGLVPDTQGVLDLRLGEEALLEEHRGNRGACAVGPHLGQRCPSRAVS